MSTTQSATLTQIPVSQLMPNPIQPRRRFQPGSIQEISDSIKENGVLTSLKVRPLTSEEQTQHTPFTHMVVGGHRRLAGAKLAGLETVSCIVLDIAPSETNFAALMDNNLEEMDWWDWDLAIEAESKATGLSVRDLAAKMGLSKSKVFDALKATRAFSSAAREIIDHNLGMGLSNPETVRTPDSLDTSYQITEYVLIALADLGIQETVE